MDCGGTRVTILTPHGSFRCLTTVASRTELDLRAPKRWPRPLGVRTHPKPDESIARQRRIDLRLPPQDPARQIRDARESCVGQMRRGRPAATATLTVQDNLPIPIERLEDVGEGRERHEPRAGNTSDVPLELLPHVDQLQLLPARQSALELAWRDFDEPTDRSRLRLRRPHTAELLVVDQRLDLACAARGARWILANVDRAELPPQRVEEEQPTLERLTDADDQLNCLGRLNRPHETRQHAQHTAFGPAWHESRRRRFREETAIAGTVGQCEDRCLAFE